VGLSGGISNKWGYQLSPVVEAEHDSSRTTCSVGLRSRQFMPLSRQNVARLIYFIVSRIWQHK
jgi:hypothetical protein